MPNGRPFDGDHVEAHWKVHKLRVFRQELFGSLDDCVLFLCRNALFRGDEGIRAAVFHFHEDQGVVLQRDDVQLSALPLEVSADDR